METKSRRRAEGARPSDLPHFLPAPLPVEPLEASHVRSGRHDEDFPGVFGVLGQEFFFVIVETARKRRHRGFRARLSSTRLVARSKRLIRFSSRREPRDGGGCRMVKRSASKMRSWVWMRSTPSLRDGTVGEPGEARRGERAGEADDGDPVEGDARPVLTPAVGEDGYRSGVGGDPRRQLAGEILGSAHEAEPGDHDGDLFSFFIACSPDGRDGYPAALPLAGCLKP